MALSSRGAFLSIAAVATAAVISAPFLLLRRDDDDDVDDDGTTPNRKSKKKDLAEEDGRNDDFQVTTSIVSDDEESRENQRALANKKDEKSKGASSVCVVSAFDLLKEELRKSQKTVLLLEQELAVVKKKVKISSDLEGKLHTTTATSDLLKQEQLQKGNNNIGEQAQIILLLEQEELAIMKAENTNLEGLLQASTQSLARLERELQLVTVRGSEQKRSDERLQKKLETGVVHLEQELVNAKKELKHSADCLEEQVQDSQDSTDRLEQEIGNIKAYHKHEVDLLQARINKLISQNVVGKLNGGSSDLQLRKSKENVARLEQEIANIQRDHKMQVDSLESKTDVLVAERDESKKQMLRLREEQYDALEEKGKEITNIRTKLETQSGTFQEVEALYTRNMEALQLQLELSETREQEGSIIGLIERAVGVEGSENSRDLSSSSRQHTSESPISQPQIEPTTDPYEDDDEDEGGLVDDEMVETPWRPTMIRDVGVKKIHYRKSTAISESTTNPLDFVESKKENHPTLALMDSIPYERVDEHQTLGDPTEEEDFERRVRELFLSQQLLFAKTMENHASSSSRANRRRSP